MNNGETITPTQCQIFFIEEEKRQCGNTAYWRFDDTAICYPCMRRMSWMNSDNWETFLPILIQHDQEIVLPVIMNTIQNGTEQERKELVECLVKHLDRNYLSALAGAIESGEE